MATRGMARDLDRRAAQDPGFGTAYVFKWIEESYGEKGLALFWEICIFYCILGLGFLFLYATVKSTSRLRDLRRRVAQALQEQQGRAMNLEDFRNLPMGGGYF